jgi:hypothetical protein
LKEKGLITYLTPEGRGCVVTHTLFLPQEFQRLQAQYAHGAGQAEPASDRVDASPEVVPTATILRESHAPGAADTSVTDELRSELESLRAETDELRSELSRLVDGIRQDLDDVKQQLGI